MKNQKLTRIISVLTALFVINMMVAPGSVFAAQATVNLGLTSTYAVLAGTTITNTGPTVINGDAGGDVGLYDGTDFPGQAEATISGTVNLANDAALQAKNALITAYNDAAGRTPATIIPSELGGTTLVPGVYASESGTFEITGTLTLNGN